MSTENQHRYSRLDNAEILKEDVVFWESLRKGNELAFSAIYKKYVQPLFNYGMHIHPDRDEWNTKRSHDRLYI